RGVLEAPLDLAVVGSDGEHARRPLVVAGAILNVVVRSGIADALIEGVGLRIVGRGLPDRAAAVLPAVLAVLPGLVAGLAGAGDGVGPPRLLAGVEIGRLDVAADPELAAGRADDREVTHDQRGNGERLAERRLGDLAFPYDFAGRLVDGEHAAIEGDRN